MKLDETDRAILHVLQRNNRANLTTSDIAEREGVDPTELTPPLYDVIDPEAIDSFASSLADDSAGYDEPITFTYRGYEVSIEGSGDPVIIDSRQSN